MNRSKAFDNAMNLLMMNDAGDVLTAVNLMLKIINNITTYPLEEKYRKVNRLSSAFSKKVGSLNGGDACMVALGFGLQQDDWILYPSAEAWDNLNSCKIVLERFARRLESIDLSSIETAKATHTAQPDTSTLPHAVMMDSNTAASSSSSEATAEPSIPPTSSKQSSETEASALLLKHMLINLALSSSAAASPGQGMDDLSHDKATDEEASDEVTTNPADKDEI